MKRKWNIFIALSLSAAMCLSSGIRMPEVVHASDDSGWEDWDMGEEDSGQENVQQGTGSAGEKFDKSRGILSEVPEGYTAIDSIDDLYDINNNLDGNYILMSDIDLTEATKQGGDYDTGCGWKPIGYVNGTLNDFTGVFDGNGYKIRGMHIYGSEVPSSIGLFGNTYLATIKNLAMENVNIEIAPEAGGEEDAKYWKVGSIAGYMVTGSITNCYVTGQISGSSVHSVGGVVGYTDYPYSYYRPTITNCYNAAIIRGTSDSAAGGIVGFVGYGEISNCYNIGEIDVSEGVSGTIGGDGYSSSVSNCYYLNTTPIHGETINSLGTALTETQMKSQAFFTGFDFDGTWTVDSECAYAYPQLKNIRQTYVKELSWDSAPLKTEYDQGETLNLEGGIVKITYVDDSVDYKILTEEMVSGYDLSIPGTQTVTVSVAGASFSYEIEVDEVTLTMLALSAPSDSLGVGETMQIEVKTEPFDVEPSELSWHIKEGTGKATVKDGLVKGVSQGTVTVVAESENGLEEEIPLTIVLHCQMILLDEFELTLTSGETYTLTATIAPKEYSDTITWSSSDSNVVTVDQNGRLTAVAEGTAQVTVLASNGVNAVCQVTVEADSWDIGEMPEPEPELKPTTPAPAEETSQPVASNGGHETDQEPYDEATQGSTSSTPAPTGVASRLADFVSSDEDSEDDDVVDMDEDEDEYNLKKVKIKSIKNVKGKKIRIQWKRVSQADGYEIQYALTSNMQGARKKTTAGNSLNLKGLKKKKYYIRIRAFVYDEDDDKVSGAWSAKYKITVKK